jgi:hypothetical protein
MWRVINMFRIATDETVSKTFRMPKRLIDKMERIADEKGLSLSKIVIQCVEYALSNLEDEQGCTDGSIPQVAQNTPLLSE